MAFPEPLGASLPLPVRRLDFIRHIVNGGDKRIWRRMTKRLKPTSAPGEGIDRDGHAVSRFGVRSSPPSCQVG